MQLEKINPEKQNLPFEEIHSVLTGGDAEIPARLLATEPNKLEEPDYLYQLDQITQAIINFILTSQSQGMTSGSIRIPDDITNMQSPNQKTESQKNINHNDHKTKNQTNKNQNNNDQKSQQKNSQCQDLNVILKRRVGLPELKKIKMQFIKLASGGLGLSSQPLEAVVPAFVDFVNQRIE